MFKILLSFAVLFAVFTSCTNSSEDLENKKAIGGVRYGGEFRFMSIEKISGLNSFQAIDLYTQRVTSQIFESLLRLDPSGKEVIPCIAESYQTSSDGRTYTFTIRKGVFFHENECFGGEGREVTAADVKYSLDMACSGLKENEVAYLLIDRIKGAKAFNKATKSSLKAGGVSGIKVINNTTLSISLVEPFASFDKVLTYSGFGVIPSEAYEMYGKDLKNHPVGTGPFMLESMSNEEIVLKRNDRYWRKDDFGNQLPYLGKIRLSFATDKRSELMAFRNEKIDLVLEIPADEVENILGSLEDAQAGKTVKHKVDSKQSLSSTFIGFAHNHPAFKDVRVRKAFNLAINRVDLVNNTLDGEGYPVMNGIIPDSDFFPASRVKGFQYNPALAKSLMAEAGFKDGLNFPGLTLYVNSKKDGDRHRIALGVAAQLKKELNVSIAVKLVGIEERNDVVSSGKAAIWVSGWIADYPDGESFLSLFYGGNIKENSKFINPFKYKSAQFDELYLKANRTLDENVRIDLMVKCDQLLIDDAVVMPITTGDFITMINSRVRNFETNSLEVLDFSTIFIKELK